GRRASLRARLHAGRDRADARPSAGYRDLPAETCSRPARGNARGGPDMNERLLRQALLETPVPAAREAEERAWELIGSAYRRRTTTAVRRRRPRLALAIAALLALLGL